MNPVSICQSATATETKDRDPRDLIREIQSGKWKPRVEEIRNAFNATFAAALARGENRHAAFKAAKRAADPLKKTLPGVLWSGTFSRRAHDCLLAHSDLLCADLDDLDAEALVRCRAVLANDPHVFSVFTSPTGSGLKVVFRVAAEAGKHPASFAAVQRHVRDTCGVEIDEACKDLARLCFVSFDEAATLNENAVELAPLAAAPAKPAAPKLAPPAPAAARKGAASAPDPAQRLTIARELFGDLDATTKPPRLFVRCPGVGSHMTGNAATDCELHLDGAPNVLCLHNSCRAAVAAANRELQSRIGKAENADLENELARLATLPPVQYERQREAAAKALGIKRVSVLDDEVAKRRADCAGASKRNPESKPDEPWPSPVNGDDLANHLRATFTRFLILPVGAAEILALWVLHTYVFEAFVFTVYLNIASATKRSGKTTLLELLKELVARALFASGVSPASIYRIVEARKPSLLIDEFDALSEETREALRGVLNSGFKRGGSVLKCDGDDHEPTEFSTYCPKALSGIGSLSDTVADRCLRILMTRKTKGETVERFRRFDGTELRRRCLRWANDNQAALAAATPALPDQLNDRQQDIVEPLLAIADAVGGHWPRLARDSLLALLGSDTDDDQQSPNVLLLADLRLLLHAATDRKIFSKALVAALKELDDRPWAGMNKGAGISTHQVGRMLRQFSIGSRTVWIDGKSAKGYDRADCLDAFERYLPPENPPAKRQNVNPPANIERNAVFTNVSGKVPDVSQNTVPTNAGAGSDVLTFPNAVLQEELL